MKYSAAILIIGSLRWDVRHGREEWRRGRLDLDHPLGVRAPIHYGRKSASRGNTFTMVLAPRDDAPRWDGGRALLCPCRPMDGPDDLWEEAHALWRAEYGKAAQGTIGKEGFGTVGVRLREGAGELRTAWRRWVKQDRRVVVPSGGRFADALVDMPLTTDDGHEVTHDVVLVAANVPEPSPPTPEQVARAWADNGHEHYFFENRRFGITTRDDHAIERELLRLKPA